MNEADYVPLPLGEYYAFIMNYLPDDWPFADHRGACRWIMPIAKLMHKARVPHTHAARWIWQHGEVIEHDTGDRVADLVRDLVQEERDRLRLMQPGWN